MFVPSGIGSGTFDEDTLYGGSLYGYKSESGRVEGVTLYPERFATATFYAATLHAATLCSGTVNTSTFDGATI